MTKPHEQWSSRTAFILAAVGAAVGFGNVWRFPSLAYEYGGGSFFIPYLLALFLVGIPVLVLEVSMGQHFQTNDVGVFGGLHKRLAGIGLISVLCGFFVAAYYVPLISWVLRALVESFGHMADDWEDISGSEAASYFYDNVIGLSSADEDDLSPTRVVWTNVAYLFLTWACIGGCIAFGIEWTGRIAYVTMGLPIIMLFVFFVRAITLEGADAGVRAYIGNWDMSTLVDRPEVWSQAVSQIFFSLGVSFGVMTAFGSHCPKGSPAVENCVIIAVANSSFSFVSGFAVFGSLGYLMQYEGADHMDDVVKSGPALLFGAYPAILSTLPGGLHWVRLLFFNLFLLGIDSAFALAEAVLAVAKESFVGAGYLQTTLVAMIVTVGFLFGIIYATDSGLYFLDVIDFYINFIMILIGFCKTFAAGWIYGLQKQLDTYGPTAVYGYMITTFLSLSCASYVWFGIAKDTFLLGFATFFLLYAVGMYVVLKDVAARQPNEDWSWKSVLYDFFFGNVFDLKRELEVSVGPIPTIWAFLIKHLIPPVLLVLFFNLVSAKTNEGLPEFGNYGGYVMWPFQTLGIATVFLVFIIFALGVIKPSMYEKFSRDQEEDGETYVEHDVEDDYQSPSIQMNTVSPESNYMEMTDK